MKILLFGKRYVDYAKKDGSGRTTGYEVHGIITEPDEEDPNLVGNATFNAFLKDPSVEVADVNQEYNVIFTMRKIAGEYKAYPTKLVRV